MNLDVSTATDALMKSMAEGSGTACCRQPVAGRVVWVSMGQSRERGCGWGPHVCDGAKELGWRGEGMGRVRCHMMQGSLVQGARSGSSGWHHVQQHGSSGLEGW